jgi:hypothetical protein
VHEDPTHDERAVRRWCWADGWTLMSQDEDLLLMHDAYMRPLLEEAAAGCTKRGYALAIVAHHVRDALHAALWPRDEGAAGVVRAVDAALARAADLAPLARSTQDAALVAYLERLVSYRRPHKVGWDEATARVLDVRRCHPDATTPVVLHQRGKTWIAELAQANIVAGALLHIDVGTGRMFGVPAATKK